jgi:hypothetical protein
MNGSLEIPVDPSLPPELDAAPRRFRLWSESRLLGEQRASTPAQPLYHYTGEAGLHGILSSQKLRCFSHLHQRDKTEFDFSLDIARQVIREVGESDDFVERHFCRCLDDVLETNRLCGPFDFYLFSLSRHRDHESQWREYGDQGRGFAIAFAPKLFQPNQTWLNERAIENVHVGRVIYGAVKTAARHRRVVERAAKIASQVAAAHPTLVKLVRPSRYLVAMAREVIASQLIWNCLTAKDSKYADEHELRYIIFGVKAKFDADRKFQEKTNKQYIETPMRLSDSGNIAEILVGPVAPRSAEESVKELLAAHGYDKTVAVSRSAISFE